MNILTLPPYMYFLHRRFLPGELQRWCLRSVGLPILATLPVVLLGRWFLPSPSSRLLTFGLIGLVWIVSAAVTAVIIPELRNEFIKKTEKLFGASYGM